MSNYTKIPNNKKYTNPIAETNKSCLRSLAIYILVLGGFILVPLALSSVGSRRSNQPVAPYEDLVDAPIDRGYVKPFNTSQVDDDGGADALYFSHSPSICPKGCTTHEAGCDIKGNVSFDSGVKIYHVPGGDFYADTTINPDYGERWFCTEAEAQANGWRRSQN